ncbi:hypothetical protein [Corynebacterium alimapuense]|uniref:hypothetical protein n=1 Tax=Corynebacterium alimapuense TaxID=1576874 RepID=UPI000F80EFE2|nr:hypothetical protein [Corynebacterium alimapuense]
MLFVVDRNYVDRADTMPDSGVGKENRWIAGLPANRDSATPIATLRERATRLEQQDLRTKPSQWRSPALAGEAHFEYGDATHNAFTWGFGDSEFGFNVSGCGSDSVYVYKDGIKAVGVIRSGQTEDTGLAHHLTPGRTVNPRVGQSVVLMNKPLRL